MYFQMMDYGAVDDLVGLITFPHPVANLGRVRTSVEPAPGPVDAFESKIHVIVRL